MFDRLLCMVEYSAMNITPEEAARSLQDIEDSRRAMRSLVRAHRGHLFLWLWGGIWSLTSIVNWIDSPRFWVFSNWLSVAGGVASVAIGFLQNSQVRSKIDRRFVAVCITMMVFGYGVWPLLLGGPHTYKSAYGYGTLIWMQIYIIAGIWFDNHWLWIGVAVSALILAGYVFFPQLFWAWGLLAGLTMVATGFYVRFFRR
jgi:hypothetical protein